MGQQRHACTSCWSLACTYRTSFSAEVSLKASSPPISIPNPLSMALNNWMCLSESHDGVATMVSVWSNFGICSTCSATGERAAYTSSRVIAIVRLFSTSGKYSCNRLKEFVLPAREFHCHAGGIPFHDARTYVE